MGEKWNGEKLQISSREGWTQLDREFPSQHLLNREGTCPCPQGSSSLERCPSFPAGHWQRGDAPCPLPTSKPSPGQRLEVRANSNHLQTTAQRCQKVLVVSRVHACTLLLLLPMLEWGIPTGNDDPELHQQENGTYTHSWLCPKLPSSDFLQKCVFLQFLITPASKMSSVVLPQSLEALCQIKIYFPHLKTDLLLWWQNSFDMIPEAFLLENQLLKYQSHFAEKCNFSLSPPSLLLLKIWFFLI